MWHRFPQPFRKVILSALKVASRNGHAAATPGDFFVAFSHVPECSAAQLLSRLNAATGMAADLSGVEPANAIAPESLALLHRAYMEADALNDRLVGSDHLLLAMTRAEIFVTVPYERVLREIRRLRRLSFGPDFPLHPVNPLTSITRTLKTSLGNAIKLYKMHTGLSALHPKLIGDPHPIYDRIRAIAPVRRDPLLPAWVVTGYPEAVSVLRDPRFSSEPRSNRTASGTMEIDMLPAGPVRRDLCVIANVLTKMMVFSDAPVHSKMRNQLGQMFSPRNVAALRDRVQQIAGSLIDAVAPSGKMDLIQDFASLLPLLVVADIMGFRREDQVELKRWSDVFGVMLSFTTTIRQDGMALTPSYLFEVKKPSESKYPWDYYKQVVATPADKAWKPLSEGGCALVKA